jgi:hypothetical protein
MAASSLPACNLVGGGRMMRAATIIMQKYIAAESHKQLTEPRAESDRMCHIYIRLTTERF